MDCLNPHVILGVVIQKQKNMSPVIPEMFGATWSMQNAQVMTTTNGLARYVVKYVTEREQNNQVTVAPSVNNSANMQVDTKLLHNTKITRVSSLGIFVPRDWESRSKIAVPSRHPRP